jgi:hypothetical protein
MGMRFMLMVTTKNKEWNKLLQKYNRKDWLYFEDPRIEEVERTIEVVQRLGTLHIEEAFQFVDPNKQ